MSEAEPDMTRECHSRSVVVWNVPATVEIGKPCIVRVGLKCSHGCTASGWPVEICDHAGQLLVRGHIGDAIAEGTHALRYADLELRAPEEPGLFTVHVRAPAVSAARDQNELANADELTGQRPAEAHGEENAQFSVRSVAPAEYRLTVIAVERETRMPVSGAKVVVHPFRAVTDAEGRAELELPRGNYRLFVSGRELFPFRSDGELKSDVTIRAELDKDLGPSDAELWS